MATMKSTFARLQGVDPSGLEALATRLRKIAFSINSEEQVLGVDVGAARLTVEVAVRRERDVPVFDELKRTLGTEKRYEYRRLLFSLDAKAGITSTPGARRDLALLTELFKRAGAGGAELSELKVDVLAWGRALLKMYDTAQLGQLVLDRFYAEPKLIGRFSAKSVDNRIDFGALQELAGNLRSLRFSFFYYDARRTVEARADGVLSVGSSDDEELEHFYAEQSALLLKHAGAAEKE